MFAKRLLIACAIFFYSFPASSQNPLQVVLAGLTHDHVGGVLQQNRTGKVKIIGIAESNKELVEKIKKRYQLSDSLFYPDLASALKKLKPEAVMAFNAISQHIEVVEACAPLGIPVMVEKPLCMTAKEAERIVTLAKKYNIPVLTNYETTWYGTNQDIYRRVTDSNQVGTIRKMIAHDGHEGPKEIGVSKEFLNWLTDPKMNGAGALVDFGCYGANLMTWMMKGQPPISVSAITHRIKPAIYPKVDDDATILLEYPEATGIIEASWNWPFSIKDFEVFGSTGYLQAVNANTLRSKLKGNLPYSLSTVQPHSEAYTNYIPYLTAVLRKTIEPGNDLSSLANNVIVVKILEAARESARTGRKVMLK
ncbi:MAG: Gfo/Idh/MocA family oxidoreductase [Chitinophagaceae bacterium]